MDACETLLDPRAAPAALTVVEVRPRPGERRVLYGGALVGRGDECEVAVLDPLVSRIHAQVWASAGAVAIEDLGSANGTWVNGQRIRDIVRLGPGDEVRLGQTVWRVLRRGA